LNQEHTCKELGRSKRRTRIRHAPGTSRTRYGTLCPEQKRALPASRRGVLQPLAWKVAGFPPESGEGEAKRGLRRELPKEHFVFVPEESRSPTISLLWAERRAGGRAVYTRLCNSKAEKLHRVED